MSKITTYTQFESYIKAFEKKKLNLLVMVSKGGLGKTYLVEETLIEQAPLIITGHITPLKLYKEVYEKTQEEKDFILVFDDVDALFQNKDVVALLKQLADTREEKIIRYFSTSPLLDDLPSSFETSCKVIILMNTLLVKDLNIQALMSRAHLLLFEPSNMEILKYMKTWATDKVIIDFIKKFAPFSKELNLRTYMQAIELKESGLDWKVDIINTLEIEERLYIIHSLLEKCKTDTERIEKFKEMGYGSRPTYFRYKKLLLNKLSK